MNDYAELREEHREELIAGTLKGCWKCGKDWPCSVIKALDELDRARALYEDALRALSGVSL